MSTKIEWTDEVWNPVTGCTKVSPGCKNCYAERMAKRLKGRYGYPVDNPFKVTLHWDRINQPMAWKKARRIFACSMGDLFHTQVPYNFIEQVFDTAICCPDHTFHLLSKRPDRMVEFSKKYGEWPSNIMPMTTVCNQPEADEKIPLLLQVPAAQHGISMEPLLGHVDISPYLKCQSCIDPSVCWCCDPKLNWVIVGGESGFGARPMHPDWVRSLRDQCVEAGVPFFFKQWGEWGTKAFHMGTGEPVFRMYDSMQRWIHHPSWINGGICLDKSGKVLRRGGDFQTAEYPVAIMHKVGKPEAGHLLDGQAHHQFPEARV